MNDNQILIKEKRKAIFVKGIIILLLMLISLFVALFPFISVNEKSIDIVFYIVGGVLFVLFTSIFIYILYKECKPNDALILTSKGFISPKHIGSEIQIEWTNVASVKILGKQDMPFLGISLENCDIVIAKMGKKEANEMRENIEENLPHILISQSELRTSVAKIKDLFIKFVRESRVLETEIPKKVKNNPFSSDDVLRAFGKLPQEVKSNSTEVKEESVSDIFEEPKENNSKLFNNTVDDIVIGSDNTLNHTNDLLKETTNVNDDFYYLLKEKADISDGINSATITETNGMIDDNEIKEEKNTISISSTENSIEMPDELYAIISQAKSTKINELEKILNDDSPLSFAQRNNIDALKQPEESNQIEINEINDTVYGSIVNDEMLDLTSTIGFIESKTDKTDSFKIILPDELYDDDSKIQNKDDKLNTTFEIDSDSSNNNNKTNINIERDDKTDTKEFYPDLFSIDKLTSNNQDDDLILPDLSDYQ